MSTLIETLKRAFSNKKIDENKLNDMVVKCYITEAEKQEIMAL